MYYQYKAFFSLLLVRVSWKKLHIHTLTFSYYLLIYNNIYIYIYQNQTRKVWDRPRIAKDWMTSPWTYLATVCFCSRPRSKSGRLGGWLCGFFLHNQCNQAWTIKFVFCFWKIGLPPTMQHFILYHMMERFSISFLNGFINGRTQPDWLKTFFHIRFW